MVKYFQSFLKRTNFLLVVLSCGCSTYTPSQKILEKEKIVSSDAIRNLYCSGTKQIKEFKISLTLADPKMIKGLSTSESSKFLAGLEGDKECLYKELLFNFSNSNSRTIFVEISDDLFKRIEKEGLGTINPDSLRSNCKLTTVFLQSSSQQIKGYHAAVCSDANGHEFIQGTDIEFDYFNSHKVKLFDLASVVSDFTFVEPKEFQEEAYGCDKNPDLCKCIGSREKMLGINSGDEFESGLAIQERDQIWERYIARFSIFKESPSSNNQNESNVEVSLDLSAFCRYGRSINDLTSK